jgi:hypothetical protein
MLALTTISCTKGTAYERFTSCSSYNTGNKRNTYVESMQTMRGPQGHRRRRATKRVVREKGYNYRRIPALVMWYLQVVSRLWCLFGNPKDAKMMFMHLISTGWAMACFNMVPMLGNGSILTPCT